MTKFCFIVVLSVVLFSCCIAQNAENIFTISKNYCKPIDQKPLLHSVILEDPESIDNYWRIDVAGDTFMLRQKINRNCRTPEECEFDTTNDSTTVKYFFKCSESNVRIYCRHTRGKYWSNYRFFSFYPERKTEAPYDFMSTPHAYWYDPQVLPMGRFAVLLNDTTYELNGIKFNCYHLEVYDKDFAGDYDMRHTYLFEKTSMLPLVMKIESNRFNNGLIPIHYFKAVRIN